MSEPELITHNESPMLSAEDRALIRARKLHEARVERVKLAMRNCRENQNDEDFPILFDALIDALDDLLSED